MSRIHEALKKAEQEREAQGVLRKVAPRSQSTGPGVPITAGDFAAHRRCRPETCRGLAAPFTLDTLLARCVQGVGHPTVKTMLFFNRRRRTGYGTEEFRTLRSRLYQMREKSPLKKVLVTQRSAEGRKVLCSRQPGASHGSPAWAARAA